MDVMNNACCPVTVMNLTPSLFHCISTAKRLCAERKRGESGGFSNYRPYDFAIIALPLLFYMLYSNHGVQFHQPYPLLLPLSPSLLSVINTV